MKNLLKMSICLCLSTGCALLVSKVGVADESVVMVFLLGILLNAITTNSPVWSAGSAVISLMLFNFFFTEPRFTFRVYRASDLVLLFFFLITAVTMGTVTSRLRAQSERANRNERTTKTMYEISSGFLSVGGVKSVVKKGEDMIKEFTGMEGAVILDADAGVGDREYPVLSASGRFGKVVLKEEPKQEQEIIIQTICAQLGIALERENLVEERERIRMVMERERQRSMMLRSISHDLRSPLTALSGSGNLLADNYDRLNDAERKKLAKDVSEETVWLIDLVENVLNMTRIGEQQLVLNKQEEVIDDIISEAVKHTKRLLSERDFKVNLTDEIVTVPMDGKLIVQVIVNLLENAIRHTTIDSAIELSVRIEDNQMYVSVSDTGSGVSEKIRDKLFEKYVTQEEGIVDGRKGLGLGLAICKTIVEAHGGKIFYQDNKPHGAVFTFVLPMEESSDE